MKFQPDAEEVPSSVPGEEVMRPPEDMCSTLHVTHAILGKESEIVPDSQTVDEPDSHSNLQGKKKKKSAREQIEEMKDTIQHSEQAPVVAAGVSSTKTHVISHLSTQQERVDGNSHAA